MRRQVRFENPEQALGYVARVTRERRAAFGATIAALIVTGVVGAFLSIMGR